MACLLCLLAEKMGRKKGMKTARVFWKLVFMCWLFQFFGCMDNGISLMSFNNYCFFFSAAMAVTCLYRGCVDGFSLILCIQVLSAWEFDCRVKSHCSTCFLQILCISIAFNIRDRILWKGYFWASFSDKNLYCFFLLLQCWLHCQSNML